MKAYQSISDILIKKIVNKENIFKDLVPKCHEGQIPLLKNLLYVIATDVLIF